MWCPVHSTTFEELVLLFRFRWLSHWVRVQLKVPSPLESKVCLSLLQPCSSLLLESTHNDADTLYKTATCSKLKGFDECWHITAHMKHLLVKSIRQPATLTRTSDSRSTGFFGKGVRRRIPRQAWIRICAMRGQNVVPFVLRVTKFGRGAAPGI